MMYQGWKINTVRLPAAPHYATPYSAMARLTVDHGRRVIGFNREGRTADEAQSLVMREIDRGEVQQRLQSNRP